MSTTEATGPAFFLLDQVDWADDLKEGAPKELVEEARKKGARRKMLARGQGSFHSSYSEFPAGYVVPTHSHNHDEMLVILEGGCTILDGGPTLVAKDSVVLLGGYEYGFEAGADGMKFLTIRTAKSGTNLTK